MQSGSWAGVSSPPVSGPSQACSALVPRIYASIGFPRQLPEQAKKNRRAVPQFVQRKPLRPSLLETENGKSELKNTSAATTCVVSFALFFPNALFLPSRLFHPVPIISSPPQSYTASLKLNRLLSLYPLPPQSHNHKDTPSTGHPEDASVCRSPYQNTHTLPRPKEKETIGRRQKQVYLGSGARDA